LIYYSNEDITTTHCDAIAHGVNCQGKMASGVAKAIRDKWPEVYEDYMENFPHGRASHPLLGYASTTYIERDDKWVTNCFTQEFYGRDGKRYANPEAIETSLRSMCKNLENFTEVKTIAIPKIGCGLGGLSWEKEVKPIIEKLNIDFSFDFWIYDNHAKP
jgi:O-acetyl-ADP-ribose deacetylase (regulator of RNase III)